MTDDQKKAIVLEYFSVVVSDTTVACEGMTRGAHKDGTWATGDSEWGTGRVCEVWDFQIQRFHIYLDRDYAGLEAPWV
ncbi:MULTISPECIES: hypothetical protein [unclassified Microbacterium]|uniref:hypothetical protein n=1 Tax=unclassified Microbacterium TaxID=2609290 RepID=UPI000CFDF9E5|nr:MULTISPECIES: hypothetical protein [unclassified Microbacterium]PQZ53503.1 hypothetical protein CQ032_15165 [Microbacterium sp. MYb43]PQZ75106.1 hypothetical protein CQ031_14520 [Microbacterium sp. MYb40]PRB19400.1 hypothetical protein CQ040_15815 [Microbacterium sp. MYb54]PRB24601.1 hypothetical protein CQ037_16320 [Microbacterium sp. MYb50]PRB63712.1 hypothetical protein CQ021_15925 [Microbacterium sp. MYb24]